MRRIIGLKFCGGCNPRIDRTALAAEVGALLPPNCRLETLRPAAFRQVAVLICGCPAACADRPDVWGLARRWIRVGGETVDCEAVPTEGLALRIAEKIDRLAGEDVPPDAGA